MAGHATNQIDASSLWGGKVSPFSTSYGKLMMWFFLVSDALTFGGLLIAYGFTRHDAQISWPIGEETFNSLPFLGHGYPLIYVALMTFILIVSSVTMVLAVEAGHRMDRKGVTKWMIATIIGGFFFLGSQAWEWSHFIHGSEYGKVELADGSKATVSGHSFENFTVTKSGHDFKKGTYETEELLHDFHHAILAGKVKDNTFTTHGGAVVKLNSKVDEHFKLIIKEPGSKFTKVGKAIFGAEANKLYYEAINSGTKNRVTYGANLTSNEYGPAQYGQFFFFITGFHGFHVFSGVMINIIIFFGVLRGIYHKRGHYEMVEKTGLYWHFVDLVWVFVFTFFYLV
jgi:cytochrome c oxidase subunit III